MLKRTIKYVDFNNKLQERDFFFHLTTAQLLELDVEVGGFENLFSTFGNEEDPNYGNLVSAFRKLIGASYGRKSEDGQYFEKSEQITNSFIFSPAYDVWFWSLFEDGGKGAMDFFNGLVPKDLPSFLNKGGE